MGRGEFIMVKQHCKHLTWNDRLIIEKMLLKKYSKREIAEVIGCCQATVYNEIKRAQYLHTNGELINELRYNPDEAQRKYREHLKHKGIKPKLLQSPNLRKYIEDMIIYLGYTPEAVLMNMKEMGIEFETTIKSVNTIYSGIRKGYLPNLKMESLPQGSRKVRKCKVKQQKRASKGTSIERRPEDILSREEFGHWEADCVVGKSTNLKTILVMIERKTRYTIFEVMKQHTSEEVVKALNRVEKTFGSSFFSIFKTITVDNGSEFQDYEGMEKALYRKGKRTKIYYCHPYAPHQKGSVENTNKLLRRFFPKGSDFDKCLKRAALKDSEFWVNTYPRKLLGGACAIELFDKELRELGFKDSG